ncbi:tetratricopeptide repeat protein [mine drainage metagenome]|uniref:Tetratricopeptide repeat protein n=1 Tax=mine drainage metagenome TaxID=410659 RepID=A0A1J5STY5_9ZZZZ
MSDKHVEVVEKDALLQLQGFWQKNNKMITGILVAIVAVIGGWYGYKQFIQKPNEEKAADLIYKAQQYFAVDSSHQVLDGDGINKGVLYVIKNYGGTKSGNLAHFYAGVSYLKLGDFNKAVEHLKDFSTDAKQIQMVAYGALGDAYSELNKKDDAVTYYKKAGTTFEKDEFSSAEYLFKAALLSETLGKTKDALDLYKEIKEKYPTTDKGFQADKYIYRLSVEKNDLGTN